MSGLEKDPKPEDDWGDEKPARLPLKKRLFRIVRRLLVTMVVVGLLAALWSSDIVRFWTGFLTYGLRTDMYFAWHRLVDRPQRDLALPDSKYKTYFVAPEYAVYGSLQQMYWLDNDRVVFNGRIIKAGQQPKGYDRNIYLWEVGKDISVYKEHATVYCATDNKIIYTANKGFYYGEFGHEERIESPKFINKLDCSPQPGVYVPGIKFRTSRLRTEHGYLEFQPKHPIKLHKPDGEIIILGENEKLLGSVDVVYYPYHNAYLTKSLGSIGENAQRSIYWLYPDGRLEKDTIAPPWSNDAPFHAAKGGYVFTGYNMRQPRGNRETGVFFIRGTSVEPLLAAGTYGIGIATSPDGCRAAMAASDTDSINGHARPCVIDLCQPNNGAKQ